MEFYFKKEELIFEEADEGMIIFDPENKNTHLLNESATYIFVCCEGISYNDLSVLYFRKYENDSTVTKQQLKNDFEEIINEFFEKKLLTAKKCLRW